MAVNHGPQNSGGAIPTRRRSGNNACDRSNTSYNGQRISAVDVVAWGLDMSSGAHAIMPNIPRQYHAQRYAYRRLGCGYVDDPHSRQHLSVKTWQEYLRSQHATALEQLDTKEF
jgi:hypothetical protein